MSSLAEDLAGTLAVDVFRRFAGIQTLAVALCQMDECPLTEVQVVCIAQAVAQYSDGVQAEMGRHLGLDADLRTGGLNWLLGHDIGGLS